MENKKLFSKALAKIPEDILYFNILPRLPVKSITRFKSVSKTWFFLICSPQFTNSHLQIASLSPPQFLILNPNSNSLHTLPYTNNNTLKDAIELNPPVDDHEIDLVGCCNGLICLFLRQYTDDYHIRYEDANCFFVVWNPVNFHCHYVYIPFTDSPFMRKYGFGFVVIGSFLDYKIVAFEVHQWGLWVFSLRARKWRFIDFPDEHPFNGHVEKVNCSGVFLDGVIYWDVVKDNEDEDKVDRVDICGLSLKDEKFMPVTPILVPSSMIFYDFEDNDVCSRLCVFKGRLSFLCHLPDECLVYVLKEHGGLSSWEKLFSMPRLSHDVYVDFAVTGKCLVVRKSHVDENGGSSAKQHLQTEIKLVGPSLGDLEQSQGVGFQQGDVQTVHHYFESFVSPFTLM